MEMYFTPVEPVRQVNPRMLAFHMQHPPVRETKRPSEPPPALGPMVTKMDFHSGQYQNPFADVDAMTEGMANRTADQQLLVDKTIMRVELSKVLSLPRNAISHRQTYTDVGSYIYKKMATMGLLVAMQQYKHELPITEYSNNLGENMEKIYESGINVVGMLPGSFFGDSRDRPIVLAAHWDVVANTTGYNDNGSGVAAMMEVARLLSGADCFADSQRHTIIFVALDSEEAGCIGSLSFIQNFIMPLVVRQGGNLQGVFVLDTILNADQRRGSQDIMPMWREVVPETVSRIESKGRVGNFLAVANRGRDDDRAITETVKKYFRHDPFDFEEFSLSRLKGHSFPDADTLADHAYFWLSDQARFWFYRESDGKDYSFPTVLLTDTAFQRGYMRECYHSECDRLGHPDLDEVDYEFLARTTQALAYAIVEMASTDMDGQPRTECPLREFHEVPAALFFTQEAAETTTEMSNEVVDVVEEVIDDGGATIVVSESSADDDVDDIEANFIGDVDFEDGFGLRESEASDSYDPGEDHPDVDVALHQLYSDVQPDFNAIDDRFKPQRHHQGMVLNVVPGAPTSYANQAKPKQAASWFSSGEDSQPVYHIGTQINIGSLVIGVPEGRKNGGDAPNLVLGSSDVDAELLANLVRSYFGQQQQQQQPAVTSYSDPASAQQQINPSAGEEANSVDDGDDDRRRNKGKYKGSSSSPMMIKLLNSIRNFKWKK